MEDDDVYYHSEENYGNYSVSKQEIKNYNSNDICSTTKIMYKTDSYRNYTLGIDKYSDKKFTKYILPFKVKKIKCGGEFGSLYDLYGEERLEYTLYWTIENKIYITGSPLCFKYIYSKLFNNVKFIDKNGNNGITWEFLEIHLNNCFPNINNNLIKNIKCSGRCVLFELINRTAVLVDCKSFGYDETIILRRFSNVKRIKRGCVSNYLVFLMNDDELKWMDTTRSDFKLVDLPTFKFGKINHLALTKQALFITTTENYMYGYGSDEWISVQLNNDEWTFVTKFESAVKSVKAGISHIVVLLENGDIFGCGLNDLEQAGQPKSFALKNNIPFVPNFTKFAFPINLIDKIEKTYCVSSGTILQTRKEFICMGVFDKENGSVFGDLCAERTERNYNLNHVSTGLGHCFFFSNKENGSKYLTRFVRNLQGMANRTSLSDIDVLINKL